MYATDSAPDWRNFDVSFVTLYEKPQIQLRFPVQAPIAVRHELGQRGWEFRTKNMEDGTKDKWWRIADNPSTREWLDDFCDRYEAGRPCQDEEPERRPAIALVPTQSSENPKPMQQLAFDFGALFDGADSILNQASLLIQQEEERLSWKGAIAADRAKAKLPCDQPDTRHRWLHSRLMINFAAVGAELGLLCATVQSGHVALEPEVEARPVIPERRISPPQLQQSAAEMYAETLKRQREAEVEHPAIEPEPEPVVEDESAESDVVTLTVFEPEFNYVDTLGEEPAESNVVELRSLQSSRSAKLPPKTETAETAKKPQRD